jgi:hypothetical protein
MVPATSDGEKQHKINVLVCSGNLGNQQPDKDSLAAWIPYDGKLDDVTASQRYPVQEASNGAERVHSVVHTCKQTDDNNNQKDFFDIIVIGMQEATFEVDSSGGALTSISAANLLASQAVKAQKAVVGLTLAKDHLKSSRHGKQNRTRSFVWRALHPFQTKEQTEIKEETKNKSLVVLEAAPIDGSTVTYPSIHSSKDHPSTIVKHESTMSDNDPLVPSTVAAMSRTDTKVLHEMLQNQLPTYNHSVSYQRGQMRLMIFHNESDVSMDVISIKAQNTGIGGLANKGGIVAEVLVDGTTRLSFFTAHLEAHEGINKYELRCSSVEDIFRGTTSVTTNCTCDAALASHFTFAMGDLNFRTRLPSHEPGSDSHITTVHDLVKDKNWDYLNQHDELRSALENNECFSGFSTPLCPFPPTFKVERRLGYAYNPKRSPSYTDRILFSANHCLRSHVKVLAYEPIDNFASSDHKPIRGAFEVKLNPRIKWRPTIVKS